MTPDGPAYSQIVLDHYRQEALKHGAEPNSTMADEIIRGREIAAILRLLDFVLARGAIASPRLLEIGCGNAYLLSVLRSRFPRMALTGIEYTPEMVAIAAARKISECTVNQGDARKLPFADRSFELVVTERCFINVMDRKDQERCFAEAARVLVPGGHFVCVEAFTDGLNDLNAARVEMGLEPNKEPHHNLWLDKPWFLKAIEPMFRVIDVAGDPSLPPPNFLSSHYFISRVMYPALTKREIIYNTHFVKFFSFLPPIGNYGPVQVHLLERK